MRRSWRPSVVQKDVGMPTPLDGFATFPDGFVWGSATSSFQIEGSSDLDGKSPSNWDVFCRTEGKIADGSNGDVACDHVRLYQDDVALIARLGLDAYRFSIAWTRVVPDGSGRVNAAGLGFYDRLVDELLAAGITPLPTLYHWDLPHVLEEKGGWLNRETAYAFADYTEAVLGRLGDRIGTWTTLNEPFVSATHGYVNGEHAPGGTSQRDGFAASHHLLLGHGLASERIRATVPDARLAIVLNFTPVEAASDDEPDIAAAFHQDNLENRWYVDPLAGNGYPEETATHLGWDMSEVHDGDLDLIAQPIDLLGVNYYTRQIIAADGQVPLPDNARRNTMGWELHPPTLGRLLRWLHSEFDFPSILITENGCPMPDTRRENGQVIDDDRLDFIRDHLTEVHSAIDDGCPVEGYLVWSLFDNFEWAWGYGPTFGIVEVDYETLERRPKKSADWFSGSARANGFSLPATPTVYLPWVSHDPDA
jgi:beta-glucosidase